MKKTIVVFGSSTGTCESIAGDIAEKLGCEAINVQDFSSDQIAEYDNLILGTSTWGNGDIQDDWYDGIKVFRDSDLSQKTVALFGCGDSQSYCDTFCNGMAEIYNAAKEAGANVIGCVDASEYNYEDSEAVVDGKFVGLAIDNDNEDDKTPSRIDAWIADIKPSL
jgi:flavodoxin I